MKKHIQLMAVAVLLAGMVACTSKDETLQEGNVALSQPEQMVLDGGSDYIDLAKGEQTAWQIIDCPDWMVPVNDKGQAGDDIRLYVESNRRWPIRTGNIVVRYANGKTHVTRADQTDEQPDIDMRRSYAAGWGFDVRTYNDSRGLRDQIFNIQRLLAFNKNAYRNEVSTSTFINFYYGDDASDLQNDMQGKLNIDGKFKVFSLDLQASFGMSAINNSKRIFSWIRDVTCERTVYLNNLDPLDAQEPDPDNPSVTLFTADFAQMRKEVIEAVGSGETQKADDAIRRLIDHYGTHFVTHAELGGCYDYYYSSTYDNSANSIDVEATLNFAYAKKFSFSADAKYEDSLNEMNQEVIEKFSVKGGDNVELTNKVFAGTITLDDTKAWKSSLSEGKKWELITFSLTPISNLFPDEDEEGNNIAEMIDSYLERLYYAEIPVTRADKK